MKQEEIEVHQEMSFEDVILALGLEIDEDEVLSVEDADVVAMACCNKTRGSCWTQM